MERKLATGGHDGHVRTMFRGTSLSANGVSQIRLWDPKTGKSIVDALKGHTKWITSLSWEPIHMSETLSTIPIYCLMMKTAIPVPPALRLPLKMELFVFGPPLHALPNTLSVGMAHV
jgi:hypothetical protein